LPRPGPGPRPGPARSCRRPRPSPGPGPRPRDPAPTRPRLFLCLPSLHVRAPPLARRVLLTGKRVLRSQGPLGPYVSANPTLRGDRLRQDPEPETGVGDLPDPVTTLVLLHSRLPLAVSVGCLPSRCPTGKWALPWRGLLHCLAVDVEVGQESEEKAERREVEPTSEKRGGKFRWEVDGSEEFEQTLTMKESDLSK
ncbi:uncharacterized protein, partial [Gorilla gorilla gorilla]|uniref:uncharacterized protein n=1 Tax=Gorilla gorilla gorilla TaxID=9595 RepID=UPI00300A67FA